MRHGSLFSGIGGFDLAAEWMGWENVFHCEWNPFGQKILHHYWPNAIQYNDITKTDFSVHRGTIDILTGGFPCQPYSMAGKRLGKEDERHLWPHMLRAIREIRPRWVVGENVLGLVNWNGGLVFDEVQADLEAEGYEVQPYVLPAVSVDAPHRRDRVWFVAYNSARIAGQKVGRGDEKKTQHGTARHGCKEIITDSTDERRKERKQNGGWENASQNRTRMELRSERFCFNGHVANSNRIRLEQCEDTGEMGGGQAEMGRQRDKPSNAIEADGKVANAADTKSERYESFDKNRTTIISAPTSSGLHGRGSDSINKSEAWSNFPTQSPICGRDDGIPTGLDGISFSKWRNESIKGYGNAVVPQVVHQIFKAIGLYESTSHEPS